MKFVVITAVPDPEQDAGNLALAGPIYEQTEAPSASNGYLGRHAVAPFGLRVLSLRQPVFTLGEILVCDDDGREIGGHFRKPDKWGVTAERFDAIEDAAAASRRVAS